MDYEIDFLPVGDESKGGDAICLRFGNLSGPREEQAVVVIDGGYEANGPNIVEHLDDYYGTKSIDVILNTHPENDHMFGLKHVLEECKVGELWMHRPALHLEHFAAADSYAAAFRTSMTAAQWDQHRFERTKVGIERILELEAIAADRDIPIVEPFQGLVLTGPVGGTFKILGPSVEYYEQLLDQFGFRSPIQSKTAAALAQQNDTLPEDLSEETLTDSGNVSAKNNSSAISLLQIDDRSALLTGDAGTEALDQALDFLDDEFSTGMWNFVQVPHHGSRRNVGPTVLDRLLGDKGTDTKKGTAFVSSQKKNPKHKHPSKKVTNAFRRRGYPVHATSGTTKTHHSPGAPDRGWTKSEALQLFPRVEVDGGDV